ncbi:MAG: holo-ACP synthase [Burkholderiaceae bacterium]|jgi:holo-[acyl-carrier protein] synthase|nr:holo-ACP synthase [Burkholderiaceae bacterium]
MDLVKMDRIDRAWLRHPERFPEKILGEDELRVFKARAARDRGRGVRYLATRFAAKEAFSKAIGLGMRMPMWWTRMQTLNMKGGRPTVVLSGPLALWYASRFGPAHVSLTDESEYGAAYVVVETLQEASLNTNISGE